MRRRREPARRALAGLVLLIGAVVSGEVKAADVRVHAERGCADRAEIADQVEALLGRPVESVEGLDFDVDLAERPDHRWRLRLATIGRADGARRYREIDGKDCAQLADAAAVAIAMSIQSSGVAAAPAGSAAPVTSPAEPPRVVVAAPAKTERPDALRIPVSLAALADAGALPHVGMGPSLGVALAWSRLLIMGEGAVIFSPEARVAGNSGGRFRLIVGAVLACLGRPVGALAILGCAGAEAGSVQAEGVGIERPNFENVGWEAGRLEVGLTGRLSTTFSIFVRGGAAMPLSRPTFTLNNETLAVHRPAVISGRLTVGALFDLF